MPDLLTHVLVGLAVGYSIRQSFADEHTTMVVLGSILLDIERPFTWFAALLGMGDIGLTAGFHSILGALLLSFAAASIFKEGALTRSIRFSYISIGTATHLLLDMMMYPWQELGLFLLFPLRISFSFHLFWLDFPFYPLIGLAVFVVAVVAVQLWNRFAGRRNGRF